MASDLVAPAGEQHDGVPLLLPVMRGGRRIGAPPPLSEIRRHAAAAQHLLPAPLKALETMSYTVGIADSLRHLADECDRRIEVAQAVP